MSLSMAGPPSRPSRPAAHRGGSSRKAVQVYAGSAYLQCEPPRGRAMAPAPGGGITSWPRRVRIAQVGPNICNVLVVLDADESHAGARHLLHRRADVFVER